MGAFVWLAPAGDDVVAELKAAAPQGVERVLVTAPPRTLLQAFEIARFGAITGFIGIECGEGGQVIVEADLLAPPQRVDSNREQGDEIGGIRDVSVHDYAECPHRALRFTRLQ